MLDEPFKIAMFIRLTVGPYQRPDKADDLAAEWLIVERSGPEATILQITEASTRAEIEDSEAPGDLVPRLTIIGLLTSVHPRAARFLFVRELPPRVNVAGLFFPAEGCLPAA